MTSISCRIACLVLSLLILPRAYSATLTLQPEQWYLLSVPGDSGQSLGEIFNGELTAENNDRWAAFVFDTQNQAYESPGINGRLQPGAGFWFLHIENSPINVELDLMARTVPLDQAGYCDSPIGCFELDLPTGAGKQWSLVGTPFPEGVVISDVQIVTSAGPCQSGCNLQLANEVGLTGGDGFQRYDTIGNEYQTMSSDDYIEALEGYWLDTTIPSGLGPAYLVFPTFCTPFN